GVGERDREDGGGLCRVCAAVSKGSMNPTTDLYRTALANEVTAASATATVAVLELSGPLFQNRLEVSRFDTSADAAAGVVVMNATVVAAEANRRYETKASTVPAGAYRTSYANEPAESAGGRAHALVPRDGPHR